MSTSNTGSQGHKWVGFLAPSILLLIALFQLIQAGTRGLSPWKGGGFGMFSTVESPSSRVVKAYLGTPQGRIPVQIPGRFKKLEQRIRTQPSQQAGDALARLLQNGTWVPYNMITAQQQYLQPSDSAAIHSALSLNKILADLKLVRMLPPEEKTDLGISLEYVEVICYQLRFESRKKQLYLEPITVSHLNTN